VLLISGYAAATLAAHGATEDEFDMLRKPFTAEQLLDRIHRACGGGKGSVVAA